jgi:medium-chain acyl-[acyl-carrier-protein] hydrolase
MTATALQPATDTQPFRLAYGQLNVTSIRPSPGSQLWFARPLPRPDARLRLFCFPHAGSGAAQFHSWAGQLPPSIELYAVRLPGRENHRAQPPFHDLIAATAALHIAITPLLDQPFAFFGHSMGALLAYELTRTLRAHSHPGPVHLFVSGRRAPNLRDHEAPIHALPTDRFISEMTRRYGPSATSLLHDLELQDMFLPVLRADFEAVERYHYVAGAPLDCPITAFGGLNDARADAASLSAWRTFTRADFRLRCLPGDHFFHHTLRDLVLEEIVGAVSRAE